MDVPERAEGKLRVEDVNSSAKMESTDFALTCCPWISLELYSKYAPNLISSARQLLLCSRLKRTNLDVPPELTKSEQSMRLWAQLSDSSVLLAG